MKKEQLEEIKVNNIVCFSAIFILGLAFGMGLRDNTPTLDNYLVLGILVCLISLFRYKINKTTMERDNKVSTS